MKATIRRPRSKNYLMTVDMSTETGVKALRDIQEQVRIINSVSTLTRTQVATKPSKQLIETSPRRTIHSNLVGGLGNAKLVDIYLYERAKA